MLKNILTSKQFQMNTGHNSNKLQKSQKSPFKQGSTAVYRSVDKLDIGILNFMKSHLCNG
mgnify:CR=1 FL=1